MRRLLFLALILIAVPGSLRAGPQDLISISTEKISDLTVDAKNGTLYFKVNTTCYRFTLATKGPTVSILELADSIRNSKSIMVNEVKPLHIDEYYDGQPARTLSRILVKP